MSLIHWWPLNGDTQDKIGNNNLQYINSSGKIVSNTSGKLGKCYERTVTGSSDLLRSTEPMKAFEEESICAWIYVSQHAALKTANGVITNHDHTTNSGLGIGVYSADGTNYYVSINAGNGSSRIHSHYWGQTNIKGAWHHVCLISNGSTIRMYVDGKEDRAALSYSVYSKADYLDIFNWSTGYYTQTSYRPACKVCDVRVYDHALSESEVKELSKALMVHYTFDDVLAEPTTNLVTSLVKGGRTTLDSTGKIITTNGEDADTYFYLNLSKTLEAGKTYTISCTGENIIQNSGGSGEFFQFGLQGQGGVPQFKIFNGRSSATFTATTKQAVNRLLLDDITGARCLTQSKFYDFQLEEKDHATPYTPSTRESMIIDESGYDHPTVLVNNCKLVTDTNSGTLALHTAGAGDTASFSACSYLRADMKTSITPTAFTVSMWAKVNTWGKQTSGVLSLNTSTDPTGYLTSTFVQYDGNFRLNNSASNAQSYIGSGIVTLGKWHHYAFTWDGTNLIGYKDGAVYNTVAASFTPDPFRYVFLGVDRAGGAVRDADVTWGNFKIYMTALSVEDIKIESKARALITDKGDIETHQFIENCETIQVTNTYNVEAQDIQEIGNEEYELLEYIASTGTQYIDTGVYWTSEKATIVADLMVTTWKGSSTIFGSEERYSGSNRYFAHILHAGSANGNYATYIGTGSIGTATLTKDTRSLIEYVAHGDKKVTIGVTVNGKKTIYVNNKAYSGTILTHQNSTQTAANRGHIYIFSNHNAYNGTGGIQTMAAMRLYRFTMIQDDIYLRDFIPCRRKSDSKIGLFDLVTGQFYTSPVGNFTAGNVVTNEEIAAKFLSGGSIQARQFIEL